MNLFVYYSHTQNLDKYIEEIEQHLKKKVSISNPRIFETLLEFFIAHDIYTPQHHNLVNLIAEGLSKGVFATCVDQAHHDGYVFLNAVAHSENTKAFEILMPLTQFLLHQKDAVGVLHEQLRCKISDRQRTRIHSVLPSQRQTSLRKI